MTTRSRLAPPSGSVFQFVLASLPMVAVLVYMLYAASKRPYHTAYNIPDDIADDDQALDDYMKSHALFPLFDMMMVFLTFFLLWSILLVYIVIFIPKRRRLVERYLQEGVSMLGDVYSKPTRNLPCRFTDYAYVRYKHPDKHDGSMIVKRVRTFQPYSREKVTILRLPEKPFSGQPASDVEIDMASIRETRDLTRPLVWFVLVWMLFTLLSPLYILHQMSLVEEMDDYESTSKGWTSFWIMVGIATPLVAIGGNWLRWVIHAYWLMDRGWIVRSGESTDKGGSTRSGRGVDSIDNQPSSIGDGSNIDYRLYGDDNVVVNVV